MRRAGNLLETTRSVQPEVFAEVPFSLNARISGGVLSSFPSQRGQNPPIDLDCSVTKSEGLLPLSVEMITHLPWIGSFLSSGMMDFSKERIQELKKGNYF
jgi:hypothetical protein